MTPLKTENGLIGFLLVCLALPTMNQQANSHTATMSTKTNTVVHHEAPLPLMNYLEDALREGRVLDYDHDGEKDPAKWVKKEDKKKEEKRERRSLRVCPS